MSDGAPIKLGVFVPPFGELADPRVLASLATDAERAGWDGFFLWDHVNYRAPVEAVADPWVSLAAIAVATSRVTLGALVTPLARRRPQIVARQLATLELLCEGRLVLGAALGRDGSGRELSAFGEELDDRRRAEMLDEALDLVAALLTGRTVDHTGTHYTATDVRFLPAPHRRLPVWIGGRWPNAAPVRRAARWDGYFPIDLTTPGDLAEVRRALTALRGTLDGYDLLAQGEPGDDPRRWADAGATWWLTEFGLSTTVDDVRRAIEARPPNDSR